MNSVRRHAEKISFWLVLIAIGLSPFEYWSILNIFDSTDYFLQDVSTAKVGHDGRKYLHVGDALHVVAYNFRHRLNGSCLLSVNRIRENVGGKFAGKRTVFQHVNQQFVGDGLIRRTSWPIAPEVIPVTDAWFDDPEAQEQEVDIYTAGSYDCNILDHIRKKLGFPRIMHDGEGHPERERTRIVLLRKPQ